MERRQRTFFVLFHHQMLDAPKNCVYQAQILHSFMLCNEGMGKEQKEDDDNGPRVTQACPRHEPLCRWGGPRGTLESIQSIIQVHQCTYGSSR